MLGIIVTAKNSNGKVIDDIDQDTISFFLCTVSQVPLSHLPMKWRYLQLPYKTIQITISLVYTVSLAYMGILNNAI